MPTSGYDARMIGIIGAMDEEVASFREAMSNVQDKDIADLHFFLGRIAGQSLVVMKSGIGKVNAAVASTLLIREFKLDLLVNSGLAGALDPELEIGDMVLGRELAQHDVDVSAFGYAAGQIPGQAPRFEAPTWLLDSARRSAEGMGIAAKEGLILSGDQFVADHGRRLRLREIFPEALAVEMEGAAIAQVCGLFSVPCLVVRAISDRADQSGSGDFKANLVQVARDCAKLVMALVEGLG